MSKIVHICSDMNFGGVGRHLSLIDHLLINKEDDLVLIIPEGSLLKDKVKNMKIIMCQGINDQSFSLKAIKGLYKILKALQPDIIHTHGALSGRIVGRLLKIPTVFTKHTLSPNTSAIKKHIKGWIHRLLNSKAIAVSKGAYENLIDEGFNKDRISIIYNGVEILENTEAQSNPVLNILFVGRLEAIKGPDECLKITKHLKKICSKPFKVTLAGAGSMAEDLKVFALEENLPVEFLGHVENIDACYLNSDIVINTSHSEALPFTLLEGMNFSKPVVAYKVSGVKEVVINDETGYLVAHLDVEAFSKKCLELLEDETLRRDMGQRGKALLKAKFSVHQMVDELWSVYKEML